MSLERIDYLLQQYFDADIAPGELAELDHCLRTQPEARQQFLCDSQMHAALRRLGLEETYAKQALHISRPGRGLAMVGRSGNRMLTAAVIGILFGIFSASLALAFRPGRLPLMSTLVKFDFEDLALQPDLGFPRTIHRWAGEPASIVPANDEASPVSGTGMLRLEPTAERLFSRQYLILDLRELWQTASPEGKLLQISAAFHGPRSSIRDRYLLRAAVFHEEPKAIDPHWMNEGWSDESTMALAHAAKALTLPAATPGWQSLKVWLELPPNGRFLVILVGAATMHNTPEQRSVHYVDDVTVQALHLQSKP